MEDFCNKTRLVAGGHMAEVPPAITYTSMASCETQSIAFQDLLYLNHFKVNAADILNAYNLVPCIRKIGLHWVQSLATMSKALIVQACYGLKSAGTAFRNHLVDCMKYMGCKPSMADPDLCIKSEIRPCDGLKYNLYFLCSVSYALCIHHDTESLF